MSSYASSRNLSTIKPTCWEEAAAHGEITMQLPPGHERTIIEPTAAYIDVTFFQQVPRNCCQSLFRERLF